MRYQKSSLWWNNGMFVDIRTFIVGKKKLCQVILISYRYLGI